MYKSTSVTKKEFVYCIQINLKLAIILSIYTHSSSHPHCAGSFGVKWVSANQEVQCICHVYIQYTDWRYIECIWKAIGQLKSNKDAGVDGIPPEAWINGDLELHTKLHELLVSSWEQGVAPQDFCDAVIITLYKNNGDKSDCCSYCGMSLLSIAGKILARLLFTDWFLLLQKNTSQRASVASSLTEAPPTW